jgi:hypothetical protein
MDVSKLNQGEKIAGVAGVALLLIMFIFDWFSVSAAGGVGPSFGGNAWDTMELIRWILLLGGISGIALAVIAAGQSQVNLPVAMSAITAGIGILGVIFVVIRIISPPDGGFGDVIDVSRDIGVFLGLIAVAGVAAGGWMAMQEEGTSFGDQADRFVGDRGEGPPPPPPPPSAPPSQPPSGGPGGPAA